jgi:hypothetical protein
LWRMRGGAIGQNESAFCGGEWMRLTCHGRDITINLPL